MDTVAEFVLEVNGADMTKFIVSGASKVCNMSKICHYVKYYDNSEDGPLG